MNAKRIFLFFILFVLLTGCTNEPVEIAPQPTATLETGTEVNAPLLEVTDSVTILAEGVMQTVQPVLALSFETSGKLLEIHVQPGDLVQAGDLIATLDDAVLQDGIAQAQLQVDRAENSLSQAQQTLTSLQTDLPLRQAEAQQTLAVAQENVRLAEAQLNGLDAPASEAAITQAQADVLFAKQRLEKAKKDYAPYRDKPDTNLNKAYFGTVWADAQLAYDAAVRHLNALTGIASEQTRAQLEADLAVAQAQLDQAQTNLENLMSGKLDESAQLSIDLAEINLTESQANLEQAQANLAKVRLYAPWSGAILTVEVSPGGIVGGGTPIVTLLNVSQLEFYTINVSERDLAQIFPGQIATITLKAYPNNPIPATVLRIGWQAGEPVGDTATFPVVLVLDETGFEIRPGMTGRVEIYANP
ncbi:MAG: efflux RND transporter periplasmic adaptor subunit [Anaerolineales bacterium]|nr:efflux RND transporter periplasmic adaptor subunit [Anaerolineales bacterium]